MNEANINLVARIVFGEARGEPEEGQLAVAFTVVNRMNAPGYPNTIHNVVHQKCDNKHEYETLNDWIHHEAWKDAITRNTEEYQNALRVAADAVHGRRPDPTLGATTFLDSDPDTSASNIPFDEAFDKIKIGNLYFVYKRRNPR
ncbi:hypothetical protein CHS0354_017707 [Potamilus streckersoni]|uniref:Cell wall hydrolase SleB domain-containing protein n=1 Tax=Potamilus streckersoni TaxID=2493646 RepID=A0AAE0S373_9BIVA|nr:hypothetical protein CHS0354_017707 [Potamilus streckersoni]